MEEDSREASVYVFRRSSKKLFLKKIGAFLDSESYCRLMLPQPKPIEHDTSNISLLRTQFHYQEAQIWPGFFKSSLLKLENTRKLMS